MNKIIRQISSIMLAMGFMASAAQAASVPVSGDIGVYSQYVWRGAPQAGGAASVQGDLGIETDSGISANVWFASLNGPSTEFDYTIDYSTEISGFGISAGAIVYTYLNAAAGNATEVYVGASYGPATITYYNAIDGSWKKDAYLALDLGYSAMGYDFGATLGYNMPNVGKSETTHFDLSASKDIEVSDVTLTPSLMLSFPMYSGPKANSTQFVAGLNMAF